METNVAVVIALLIAFGLFFGQFIAKNSQKTEKIRGGKIAEICHYIACSIMIGLVPSVFAEVFVFRLGFVRSFLIALLLVGIVFINLMIYAYFELPAKAAYAKEEDKGWTAEDALTSGL